MLSYDLFIRRRQPLWRDLQAMLERLNGQDISRLGVGEVEHFASLYQACLADYAHLTTHYPKTRAQRDLNDLVLKSHYALSTTKPANWKRVWSFFFTLYPGVMRENRRFVVAALAIFLFFSLWGYIVTALHPSFAALFLGPEGLADLARGNFWVDHVVQVLPRSIMAVGIWTNNVSVAILSWALGIFAGLGSLYMLAQNGIMLGTVLQVTGLYNMSDRLVMFILGHGLLEIFLLTVACGAGLRLAWGVINPTRIPWRLSLEEGARSSVIMLVGTFPWFIFLGFIEAFFSPSVNVPMALHAVVGTTLLAAYLLTLYRRG